MLAVGMLGRSPHDMLVTAHLGGVAEPVVHHLTDILPGLSSEVHRFPDTRDQRRPAPRNPGC